MMRSLSCLLLALTLLAVPVGAQESGQGTGQESGSSAWIVDQLYLSLYPEPDSDAERLSLMVSGDRVERLDETENGFVRVRLQDGTSGWVNDQYLVDEPPARVRIDEVEAERDRLADEVAEQSDTIASLRERVNTLETQRNQAASEAASVEQLQARVNSLQAERDRLAEALSQRDERLASLERANQELREQRPEESEEPPGDIVELAQPVLRPDNAEPALAASTQPASDEARASAGPGLGLSAGYLAGSGALILLALVLAGVVGYRLRERQLRQRLGGLSL